MSASSDWVYRHKDEIQAGIDALSPTEGEGLFDLRDVTPEAAWDEAREMQINSTVTWEFAQRIRGYPACVDPIFERAQSRQVLGETDGKTTPYFRRIEG